MSRTAYQFLDTNRMPWVNSTAIRGRWRKILLVEPESRAFVQMNYTAPGFGAVTAEALKRGPRRHYHRTVNERHYWLAGDYPAWRWSHPKDMEGEFTTFYRHGYLENPPRAIHGIRPETVPKSGSQLLAWANGPGTGINEPEAAQETVDVPFENVAETNEPFSKARLFSSEDLAWNAHPAVANWKTKHIGDGIANSPTASLINVPADSAGPADIRIPGDKLRWLFVLSGDLTVNVTENKQAEALTLKENCFLSWQNGAEVSYPRGAVSAGGCVALCIGHDLARGLS